MTNNYEHKLVSTDSLIPYVNNARTHSQEQVDQVAASIREFGFTNPILVDEQSNVIAGHGRLQAAQKLGLAEIPAIVVTNLTEAKRKALIIADNKLALNSGWDEQLLAIEIETLRELDFDIDILGFDPSELNFDEIDYSVLDDAEIDAQLEEMEKGVRKAIQIEYETEHYDEAFELVKWWREQGAYVGYMILNFLRAEKDKA